MEKKILAVILALLVGSFVLFQVKVGRALEPVMWASEVVAYQQGSRKDGSPVLPIRSNPNNALGPPDSIGTTVKFFSLGFGGWIILGFPCLIGNGEGADALVIEVTWGTYPEEKADVYVSQDGSSWTYVGTVNNKGQNTVGLPSDMLWARYVKIVDATNPAIHSNDADGFDLDAVGAYYKVCVLEVSVDIKPGSWPNPINIRSFGVFAAAILGAEDFDTECVDPDSIMIYIEGIDEGVAPLRWNFEDVNCDGYMDLVFHFDTQTVVNTLHLYEHVGETIPLIIKGSLYDGIPIKGEDYVWVIAPRNSRVIFPL